jgi:Mn-containing catalase
MDFRQILSTGLSALPSDANGVPFDMSHIYASGNLAADMYCNVAAEATGRALAARLYHMTDDPGMKDMLQINIAGDTMHQQQWLAVLEELGPSSLPIPNSFPRAEERVRLQLHHHHYGWPARNSGRPAMDKRPGTGRRGHVHLLQRKALGPGAESWLRSLGYLRTEGAGAWNRCRHAGEMKDMKDQVKQAFLNE